jgi:hypothetical protein
MAWIAPEWIEHQRRRFTRHDAHRFVPPGSAANESCEPPADLDSADGQHVSAAELQAERAELLSLKSLVAQLQWQLALRRFARKYRPDQPRDDRGRWVDEGRPRDPPADAIEVSAARKVPSIVREFGK